jgi:hypothetical protein
VAAFARALGYAHLRELMEALKRKVAKLGDPEFDKKYQRAIRKLFAKFDSMRGDALERMYEYKEVAAKEMMGWIRM